MLRAMVLLLVAVSLHVKAEVQYGGELNVGTVNVTLSALSWDPRDWVWKANHDLSLIHI